MTYLRQPVVYVCLAMLVQVCAALVYAVTLHVTFKTSGFDIGVFEQILYNFLGGRGLVTTFLPPNEVQHWFSIHFSPILYLLAPIYYVWQDEIWIRGLNVLLLSSAALPLFYIVQHILREEWPAAIFAIAYLLNPFLFNATIWDFHEIAFAPLLFCLGYWAVLFRRRVWFLVACAGLIMVKEHYGVAVAGFALLWAHEHKEWRFGLVLAAVGLAAFAVIVGWIIPSLNPLGGHFMVEGDNRFNWVNPDLNWNDILLKQVLSVLSYLLILGLIWIFLPAYALWWVLPGAADLLVNCASLKPFMREAASYHTAPLVAVLTVAAAQGSLRFIVGRPKLFVRDLGLVVGIMATAAHFFFSVLPYTKANNIWEFDSVQLRMDSFDSAALADIRALTGTDDALMADANVAAHLGDRPFLYPFLGSTDKATWLVFRLYFPFHHSKSVGGLPYGIGCDDYVVRVWEIVKDRGWGVAYWNRPWLVLKRGGKDTAPGREELPEAVNGVQAACERAGWEFPY